MIFIVAILSGFTLAANNSGSDGNPSAAEIRAGNAIDAINQEMDRDRAAYQAARKRVGTFKAGRKSRELEKDRQDMNKALDERKKAEGASHNQKETDRNRIELEKAKKRNDRLGVIRYQKLIDEGKANGAV
jgi:hypothetical protein